MNMLYLVGAILITFNILDSVTTHIALYKLPDDLKAKESNPLMARMFVRHYKLAQGVKHAVVFIAAAFLIIDKDLFSLEVLATLLSLVVINNTYILIFRKVMGKRVDSPVRRLQRLLHIPDKFYYVLVGVIFIGLSLLIVSSL